MPDVFTVFLNKDDADDDDTNLPVTFNPRLPSPPLRISVSDDLGRKEMIALILVFQVSVV